MSGVADPFVGEEDGGNKGGREVEEGEKKRGEKNRTKRKSPAFDLPIFSCSSIPSNTIS